jgi:hypothetical protein
MAAVKPPQRLFRRLFREEEYFAEIVHQRREDHLVSCRPFDLHGVIDLQHMQVLACTEKAPVRRVDVSAKRLDDAPRAHAAQKRGGILAPQSQHFFEGLRIVTRRDRLGSLHESVDRIRLRDGLRATAPRRRSFVDPAVRKLICHGGLPRTERKPPKLITVRGIAPDASRDRPAERIT